MDTAARRRLKWKCRRGLLELDLVLERFLQGPGRDLPDEALERLDELLDRPDHDLWDLFVGRSECRDERYRALVEELRAC